VAAPCGFTVPEIVAPCGVTLTTRPVTTAGVGQFSGVLAEQVPAASAVVEAPATAASTRNMVRKAGGLTFM
jgi:hypothetical protein